MATKRTNPALLTLKQTAEQLSVSIRTVRRWVKAGELPAIKLGSQWRIDPDDLALFLFRRRQS